MSKKRIDTTTSKPLRSNPFASLGGAAPADSAEDRATPAVAPGSSSSVPARAVVRYQRKGRGGKEVTLVDKLGLSPEEMQEWAAELKRSLGCGGHVEDGLLIMAGDQRARLPELLRDRGVRKVTVS